MEVALIIVGAFAVFAVLLVFTPLITTKMMKNNMNTMRKMTEEMSSGNMSDTLKELSKNAVKIKKDIMNENYDDLKELEEMEADIESAGIKKKARAAKEGFSGEQIHCKHCGKKIDSDSKFCKFCGLDQ